MYKPGETLKGLRKYQGGGPGQRLKVSAKLCRDEVGAP